MSQPLRVTTYPTDYTISTIVNNMKNGYMSMPDFQREYVWNIRQASLLLFSFMKDMYVPACVLVHNTSTNTPRCVVLDGRQRLTTICKFFGACSNKGTSKVTNNFKLDLPQYPEFNGKGLDDLSVEYKSVLTNKPFRMMNIMVSGGDKNSIKEYIYATFEVINTTGTPIKEEELQKARNYLLGKGTN